jgi:hypothetical protein
MNLQIDERNDYQLKRLDERVLKSKAWFDVYRKRVKGEVETRVNMYVADVYRRTPTGTPLVFPEVAGLKPRRCKCYFFTQLLFHQPKLIVF